MIMSFIEYYRQREGTVFDPETRGFTKLALEDARKKKLQHLPPGTHVENGRVILPPIGFGAALIGLFSLVGMAGLIVLASALIGTVVRGLLLLEVGGVQIYLALAAAGGCLTLGGIFFWYREIRRHPFAAVAQVVVGAAGGSIVLLFA